MISARHFASVLLYAFSLAASAAPITDVGNRLTYLDEADPFYVHRDFPKLITPQWVGEPGVEAVVILAIDDLREPSRYEAFLRPILDRLKRIDGRAPVSIYCNALAPTNALFTSWLTEGLSLEIHTLSHPCPLLAKGNFAAAADTYHGGIDLLRQIPGNVPVAFRMPCCDSMNSPSPRFYAEMFNRVSAAGHFLTIDSSVMQLFTSNDPSLRREWVLDADGRERFRKYLPTETNAATRVSMKSFVTTIEDYPYPYVIGRLCWEFPAMAPSDWEAQNLHGVTNPVTVADWQAALDATVAKQGVFTFVFHPHGWIRSGQLVEFIDYAVQRYGGKVKFLNFREAQARLDQHLLAGHPLRASNGQDHGVRLLDVNHDGYLDVVIGHANRQATRIWDTTTRSWRDGSFPTTMTGVQFGVVATNGFAAAWKIDETAGHAWQFDGARWAEAPELLAGLELDGVSVRTAQNGRDRGVRLRDADRDGRCELIVGNEAQNAVFGFAASDTDRGWRKLDYALPPRTAIVDAEGRDAGLRFVDVNGDGFADALFSDAERFSLHQFITRANPRLMWKIGWNDEIIAGVRGAAASKSSSSRGNETLTPSEQSLLTSAATNIESASLNFEIPPVVRAGVNRNNGTWFHSGAMWIQNEDTAHLPDHVDRRTFAQLLAADQPQPKPPAESLASMKVRPGFKVELVASEPLVADPIAFEWGADGKLWVVEMSDYPLGVPGDRRGGRVRFLEDTDNDGRYDRSTIFLDGLNYPTGVMPWRNGVIVSAAPDIFFATDTDGDGRADVRRVLFTGFVEGNPQHRVNGFEFGLDNWLYAANGDSGGRIKAQNSKLKAQDDRGVSIDNRDMRFRPDTGEFEAIAGQTQFGRHRDDWGNWFGNNNPTWLWHFFIDDRYTARNPHLPVRTTKKILANYDNGTRLFPASRTRQRFNDHHQFNHVTSGCSAMPYRDDLFGPAFARSVFISDPVHNVVHREVLEPDGVSFTSRRAAGEEASEFLASADNLFRPITLKTGPDGALYVADMYRGVLEHPEWIPAHILPRLDLRAGAGMGRIYRVFPDGAPPRPFRRLDRLTPAQLVAALDSPNGWQRDTAQRLMVHSQDKSVVPALRELLKEPNDPRTRLQALCTLDGLGAATPKTLAAALRDSHPAVREHAVRLSEPWLRLRAVTATDEDDGDLRSMILGLAESEPELRVRYQLAFSLGEWDDTIFGRALAHLARRDFAEPQMQLAVMSSAPRHLRELLAAIFGDASGSSVAPALAEQLIGLAVAQKEETALAQPLAAVARRGASGFAPWQFASVAGLLDALERRNLSLAQWQTGVSGELKSPLGELTSVFDAARRLDATQLADAEFAPALRLLGRGATGQEEDWRRLGEFLRPQTPPPVQRAALAALRRFQGKPIAEILLAGWDSYSPALREPVLAALTSRADWANALLDALKSGRIATGELGPVPRQSLLAHSQRAVRETATNVLTAAKSDRLRLIDAYRHVASLRGDAARGAELFRQNCAACHVFRGEGHAVGPDLAMVSGKPIDQWLVAILDPNQAVEWRYVSYRAMTRSGQELLGVISAETPSSITLRTATGQDETLLRSALEDGGLKSTKLSLMPEGFEAALNPQAMADLLAYLRGK